MDALEKAKETMEWVDGENPQLDDFFIAKARALAAIAQAEQLKRIADATERRNELLAEYNAESKASADRHTASIATSVSKFVSTIYGESDTE